jgi:hypothetical protein
VGVISTFPRIDQTAAAAAATLERRRRRVPAMKQRIIFYNDVGHPMFLEVDYPGLKSILAIILASDE